MCTVTVWRTSDRLLVTMNRDEVRDRAPEEPPRNRREDTNGIEWLAPVDGQARGTWMATNDRGLHACLLNQYLLSDASALRDDSHRPSRGGIIVDLMRQGDETAAVQWLESTFDPRPFASFLLVFIGSQSTRSFAWNGQSVEFATHHDEWSLFTSSSWRSAEVTQYRRREFQAWLGRGAPFESFIPAFHLLAPPELAAWAPLMSREHSATRSVTQIEAHGAERETQMRHWAREQLVPRVLPPTTSYLETNNEPNWRRHS